MTIDEKVEAYRMRLNGASLQECADRFGVSRERIRQIIPGVGERSIRQEAYKSCIYPNISNFMYENQYNYHSISKMTGFAQVTVSDYLTGKKDMRKRFIDKILDITDMTYEEAFKKEAKNQ